MNDQMKKALERIEELESEAQDQQILVDLLYEDKEDLKTELRSAIGQLNILRSDRRYEVG